MKIGVVIIRKTNRNTVDAEMTIELGSVGSFLERITIEPGSIGSNSKIKKVTGNAKRNAIISEINKINKFERLNFTKNCELNFI